MNKSIHIIGSGLAGLSCAINLSKKHGRNVILYEASSLYGGRCRSYKEKNFNCILDNGNHLIIKAYKNTFNYLKKIKSQKELIARIKAVLRRTYGDSDELVFGDIKFDLDSHQVFIKNKKVHIGRREYRLLRFLMQNNGKVYSRAQLLDHVWGQGNFFQERTVDVHIRRLRSLLENHKLGNLIQTVRGTGYGFNL